MNSARATGGFTSACSHVAGILDCPRCPRGSDGVIFDGGQETCIFTDYKNPPGDLDFVLGTRRAQEFEGFMDCVGALSDEHTQPSP